ncbi:MAG: hypothetical protein CM15mP47_2480 [Methanobacteriota archaeon]|nr:MAG: hypothetical protein CM15mP47_2480 [Euryarchaeota archaeon]
MLNSSIKSANSLISHLAVPSDIQPSYAPSDQSLVTVTVVGEDARKLGLTSKQAVEESVIKELSHWFPGQVDEWRVLEVQYIESGLPEFSGEDFDNMMILSSDNFCGDSTYHASVEGALISAQRVIDNLVKSGSQD